jgi:hypothetical protein
MLTYQPKITFGDVRASCVRDVLVYCRDHRCSHDITVSAERWPDHVRRLSDIEPEFVCIACGKRGAEVRPLSYRLKGFKPRPKQNCAA